MEKLFKEEWPSIAQHTTPEWFRDAKFGIYACLGPASVATQYETNEWYGWVMYQPHPADWTNHPPADKDEQPGKEFLLHRKKWGDQHEFGYKDFIMEFQPT